MSETTQETVMRVLDRVTRGLLSDRPPAAHYELYLSSKQAREVEVLGGIQAWFAATQEERDVAVKRAREFAMTIPSADIHDCPEHGLFANPNYWPCPFCYPKDPIEGSIPIWTTTFIVWKGEERSLCLGYRPCTEPWNAIMYRRVKEPNDA